MLSIQDELISTIETLVSRAIDKQNRTRDVVSVVTGVNNGLYEIIIDGQKYWVKDGVNVSPTTGTNVWVKIPNGNINLAYIAALR